MLALRVLAGELGEADLASAAARAAAAVTPVPDRAPGLGFTLGAAGVATAAAAFSQAGWTPVALRLAVPGPPAF